MGKPSGGDCRVIAMIWSFSVCGIQLKSPHFIPRLPSASSLLGRCCNRHEGIQFPAVSLLFKIYEIFRPRHSAASAIIERTGCLSAFRRRNMSHLFCTLSICVCFLHHTADAQHQEDCDGAVHCTRRGQNLSTCPAGRNTLSVACNLFLVLLFSSAFVWYIC